MKAIDAVLRALAVLSCVAVAAAPTHAQAEPRLAAELRTLGFLFDNLFQAPPGERQEDVRAFQVEGRLDYQLDPGSPLKLHARAGYTDYDSGLEGSPSVGLGLRSEAKPQSFEVLAEYLQDRPSLDVGDVLDQADVVRLTGRYGYRVTPDWEVTGLGDWEQQRFAGGTRKDNDYLAAGATVRYRGFGYVFHPELGATFGERDVDDESETHDQRELWVKVTSVPIPPLYLSLRYRQRERDYTTGDRRASNFGRDDDRRQWTLTAAFKTGEHLSWNLYWTDEDAESTRADREFEAGILALGVSWRL